MLSFLQTRGPVSRGGGLGSHGYLYGKNRAKVAAATKRHGKALGRLVPNVETGIEYNKLGFDFICYSGDVWILQGALTDAVGKLRDGCISQE